jgi:hypothetical protein
MTMKKIKGLIMSMLGDILEQLAEKMGIVRYAISVNPWMSGERGRIDQLIFYKRKDVLCTRRRPQKFKRKDPASWQGRLNRFSEYMKLGKCFNFKLAELYETEEPKLTFFNMLTKQLNKFWVGGPAPAPYVFTPGAIDVKIGNGSLPDARNVMFTPSAGLQLSITWDASLLYDVEYDDDVLQVMLLKNDGTAGKWFDEVDTPPVKRSAGSATIMVPNEIVDSSAPKIYCAIKFKAGAEMGGKAKGIFRFPLGIEVITLIP